MYLYIIECSDKTYYTGLTTDLETRISQHNLGLDTKAYTFKRRPVVLKYAQHYSNPNDAIAAERQLKGWSRAKKEAFMNNDWDLVSKLARSKGSRSSTSSE
jgi:putative endonuclease